MRRLTGILAGAFLLPLSLAAANLTISGNITVNGTDVFSGPTFVVSGNYTGTDTFSLRADGTVDLASGLFTANAAGIVVAPAVTNTGATPGQVTLSGGFPYAALLIGNGSLGFFPVFPANAANGLGDTTPPTTLTLTAAPLSSIFGAGVNISNGTVLEFRINDINSGDNSGGFRLSAENGVSAVPEPASAVLVGAGLAVAGLLRRRRLTR